MVLKYKQLISFLLWFFRHECDAAHNPFENFISSAWRLLLRRQRACENFSFFDTMRCFVHSFPALISADNFLSTLAFHDAVRFSDEQLFRLILFKSRSLDRIWFDADDFAASHSKEHKLSLLKEFRENELRFRNKWSALVPLCFGLASMDLPVLVVTVVEKWLVAANDQRFASYPSSALKWAIARHVKRAAQQQRSDAQSED